VLAYHGVVPLDLTIPCDVFGLARSTTEGDPPYEVRVCGAEREIRSGVFDLLVPLGLSHVLDADTVVLPGIADLDEPIPQEVIEVVLAASARGARVASICSGAFVLAATGLLDGLRATTHWLAAGELARRHPNIEVDPNVLFIDNGQVLTSAGATAGFDLCLHMVRRDYGAKVAADVARLAVMPLERAGGQAQFIIPQEPSSTATLQPLLSWMTENLHRRLSLEEMARHASMSTRTLNRKFREQTGTTPLQWLLEARVRHAQRLLETTTLSIERVALAAGFQTAMSLRGRFRTSLSASPSQYRLAFGGGDRRKDFD
jgi:transcriptional regulator GlxA family with amidase domain